MVLLSPFSEREHLVVATRFLEVDVHVTVVLDNVVLRRDERFEGDVRLVHDVGVDTGGQHVLVVCEVGGDLEVSTRERFPQASRKVGRGGVSLIIVCLPSGTKHAFIETRLLYNAVCDFSCGCSSVFNLRRPLGTMPSTSHNSKHHNRHYRHLGPLAVMNETDTENNGTAEVKLSEYRLCFYMIEASPALGRP